MVNKRGVKVHATPQEAFACHARYLISQGYTRLGQREFHKEGEPIRVLTKKSRFGGILRGGKKGDSGTGKRLTYRKRGKTNPRGCAILSL
jgi:hypothetical protein